MKKILTLILVLAIAGPAVACLCASTRVEVPPACAMDCPESCCCETEVQTPPFQQVGDFVPATPYQLNGEWSSQTSSLSQARLAPEGNRIPDARVSGSTYPPGPRYLTFQSFLI